MNTLIQNILPTNTKQIFALALAFAAICFGGGLLLEQQVLFLIPFALVAVGFVVWDYRILYVLFLLTLPFSVEVSLSNGLGTDLPTEPLMLGITGIAGLLFLNRFHKLDYRYLYHPVTIFMILHICWIGITAIGSQNSLISFKYLLAKIWYVVPFFFMPFTLIKSSKETKKTLYLLMIPLMIAVLWILYRHAGYGFTFAMSNEVVYPIFRNHVNYAAILVMFLPFAVGLRQIDKHILKRKRLISIAILILVVAIYFSYTRAAQASILIAIAAYFMIIWKLTKPAIIGALLVLVMGVFWLVQDNNYLNYAPDYNNAVTHVKFDNLIEATYKLEDISTMERVHRWVAGSRMIAEKPLLGYGPANFYTQYKDYTLTEFKTYVSDNPEKSGIHNYYMMIAVEQGVFGLIIFLLLLIYSLTRGEKLYHQLKDRNEKILLMSAMTSIIVSCAILLINDMLEADKVGPLFFFSLSIIVIYDVKYRRALETENS